MSTPLLPARGGCRVPACMCGGFIYLIDPEYRERPTSHTCACLCDHPYLSHLGLVNASTAIPSDTAHRAPTSATLPPDLWDLRKRKNFAGIQDAWSSSEHGWAEWVLHDSMNNTRGVRYGHITKSVGSLREPTCNLSGLLGSRVTWPQQLAVCKSASCFSTTTIHLHLPSMHRGSTTSSLILFSTATRHVCVRGCRQKNRARVYLRHRLRPRRVVACALFDFPTAIPDTAAAPVMGRGVVVRTSSFYECLSLYVLTTTTTRCGDVGGDQLLFKAKEAAAAISIETDQCGPRTCFPLFGLLPLRRAGARHYRCLQPRTHMVPIELVRFPSRAIAFNPPLPRSLCLSLPNLLPLALPYPRALQPPPAPNRFGASAWPVASPPPSPIPPFSLGSRSLRPYRRSKASFSLLPQLMLTTPLLPAAASLDFRRINISSARLLSCPAVCWSPIECQLMCRPVTSFAINIERCLSRSLSTKTSFLFRIAVIYDLIIYFLPFLSVPSGRGATSGRGIPRALEATQGRHRPSKAPQASRRSRGIMNFIRWFSGVREASRGLGCPGTAWDDLQAAHQGVATCRHFW
ncbi:hypothetical protein C8R46DRAFT_1310895 [Mycena filopes]|nr:hypothetical protein C8R46DRAFT_1310895 [Mycena filopes]